MNFKGKIELLKMEQKKVEYQKGQKGISFYRLGPNCEDRICSSCKIIVEEFGNAVIKAITNVKYKYVMDILEDNFCGQRDIQMKYKPQVFDLCKHIVKTKDYKDTFINEFEEEPKKIEKELKFINRVKSITIFFNLSSIKLTPFSISFTSGIIYELQSIRISGKSSKVSVLIAKLLLIQFKNGCLGFRTTIERSTT